MHPFEDILNYCFFDKKLLQAALSHPSLNKENRSFERLEFLGDRVLSLVISDLLYEKFPKEKEGDLAKRLAALVNKETLTTIATEKLQLQKHLIVSKDDMMTPNSAILCDAIEAVIAVLFLDGGYQSVRRIISRIFESEILTATLPPQDSKTTLQEWAQSLGLTPVYTVTQQKGPAHSPHFTLTVNVPGKGEELGEGLSKRQAEQQAAKRLLDKLQISFQKK